MTNVRGFAAGVDAELGVGRDLLHRSGQESGFRRRLMKPGPATVGCFEHVVRGQLRDDLLRHVRRLLAEGLGQRHREVRLVVAVLGVRGWLDGIEQSGTAALSGAISVRTGSKSERMWVRRFIASSRRAATARSGHRPRRRTARACVRVRKSDKSAAADARKRGAARPTGSL